MVSAGLLTPPPPTTSPKQDSPGRQREHTGCRSVVVFKKDELTGLYNNCRFAVMRVNEEAEKEEDDGLDINFINPGRSYRFFIIFMSLFMGYPY